MPSLTALWHAALATLMAVAALPACAGPPTLSDPGQPSALLPIVTLAEGHSYRGAATLNDGAVTWALDAPSLQGAGSAAAAQAARDSIRQEAARLAVVDYASLALPAFVTPTRSLTLTMAAFTGEGAFVEAAGMVDGKPRYALYQWDGPEISALPGRPLVSRWVVVYALYDLDEARVVRLVTSIRGQVLE